MEECRRRKGRQILRIGRYALDQRSTARLYVPSQDVLNRARLAVGHGDGPADQLLLGSMQSPEDVDCWLLAVAHARDQRNAAIA